jgi:cytochrome c-type biogenesis protein
LPELAAFYEKHKDKRDKFEILAFHDPAAKTFEELDKRIAPIQERYWKGKPLPFPILLDASGETISQWGIRAFPTTILIDPEGRQVRLKGHGAKAIEAAIFG